MLVAHLGCGPPWSVWAGVLPATVRAGDKAVTAMSPVIRITCGHKPWCERITGRGTGERLGRCPTAGHDGPVVAAGVRTGTGTANRGVDRSACG